MRLRFFIKAGIGLYVLTIAISLVRYPGLRAALLDGTLLIRLLAPVVCYGYAVFRSNAASSPEDVWILRYGAIWGVAVGCAWAVEVIFANVIGPPLGAQVGFVAALVALLLPFLAGAASAIKAKRFLGGVRVGFWSGVVSGLIAFFVIAAVGYLSVLIPGLPGAETCPGCDAAESEQFAVGEYLSAAVAHGFMLGAVFCTAAATIGGLIGFSIYRTGA